MDRHLANQVGKSVGRSVRAASRAATRAATRAAARSLPKTASRSASLGGAAATTAVAAGSSVNSLMENLKSPWVLLGICIIAGLIYYFFVYRKQQEIDQVNERRSQGPSEEEWEQIQRYQAQQQALHEQALHEQALDEQQALQEQQRQQVPTAEVNHQSNKKTPTDEEIMPQITQSVPNQEEGSEEETNESNFQESEE